MNIIDIILALIILLALWNGISKGFYSGMAGLISWLGSLLVTFWLYRYLSEFVETHVIASIWTIPLTFLITLLVVSIIFSTLTGQVIRTIPQKTHDHKLNKLLGLLPGAIMGILYAAIVSALLLLLPLSDTVSSHTRNSWLAQRLTTKLERVEQQLTPVFEEAVNRSMNKMTIDPASTKKVDLPFTVKNPKPRPDLETEMLQLINEERAKVDLPPLKNDVEMIPVARQHSADMFARGYFSHITLEGDTPFDRIRKANLTFLAAGENLAIAQTLLLAHEGLMDSPGHRANILRPAFGRVGIGILDGGVYGLMVTQKFRN
ncbi:CvpA family protein [Parapedobacter tibetensis]|uniref:CvpA family protein n=1 Tax=Parapedobacter tibetensis TaxID=2972951 RepID=UPI00214D2D87|nr:CvpA family protein [Parapedobacter tibetensis]